MVVRHAPGSAMMRDFSEVVADKTVTGGNARAYRFKSPDPASTPARPTDRPSGSSAATPTPATDAGKAVGGLGTSSSREDLAPLLTRANDGGIRVGKRTRSSPASRAALDDATPAPATTARGTPVPPARPAASSARATPFGTGRAASRLASAAQPTRGPQRLNDDGGAPNHRGRGAGNDGNDAAPVANLVKALDEAGDEEPRRKRRRGDAKTPAKTREKEEREAKIAKKAKEAKEAKEAKDAKDAAAEAKRAAAAAKRKAQREERERERAAERAEKENRRPDGEDAAAALPERKEPHVRSRELASLDPMSGPDARRQREAALLAVAAVEAAAEAEAAKPKASNAQTLLAAFYDLTGREPPPGVVLPDASAPRPRWSGPSGRRTRATWRCTARCTSLRRRPSARFTWRPVCIGPFGGAAGRDDFARAYHGAPVRVVSAGAELARACEYLGRVDAVDAERRAANEGGARSDGA